MNQQYLKESIETGVARGAIRGLGACEPSQLSREAHAWTYYGAWLAQLEAVKQAFDDAGMVYPAPLHRALERPPEVSAPTAQRPASTDDF